LIKDNTFVITKKERPLISN